MWAKDLRQTILTHNVIHARDGTLRRNNTLFTEHATAPSLS